MLCPLLIGSTFFRIKNKNLVQAISLEEKDVKGDKNPKDFILFFDADFLVLNTIKDNTGSKQYIEGMVFPTLKFPSDHGITSTILYESMSPVSNDSKGNVHRKAVNLAHSLRFE